MDLCSVCFTLLACVGLSFGQSLVLPDRLNGVVGGSITFTPISLPPLPYKSIIWASEKQTIVNATEGSVYITDNYVNRVSFDINTLSMELRNLTESDAGTYSLSLVSPRAKTSLQVFVPVSTIIIEPSETELIEFSSSVSLTCSASGSSLSYLWFNRSSEVSVGERVVLTDGNRTLIIKSVRRDDSGPYTCEASNIISNKRSPPLSLNIYFGPNNLRIEGPSKVKDGETLTLSCITESTPKPSYKWIFDGRPTQVTTEVFTVENATFENSGTYTCRASNQVTGLHASVSHVLVVKGDGGGLSGGAIAGIVIGVLLGVAVFAGLICWCLKR